MKYFNQICVLLLVVAVSFVLVGCGGGSKASKSKKSATKVELGETETCEGVTLAPPKGWKSASRQAHIIMKYNNPKLEGQSVYVKVPKPVDGIKTLETKEDAEKAELKGEMVKIGDYVWMRRTQISKDPNGDKFDNLICATVQFGKIYEVYVRGFQKKNDNCDKIMEAVLSKIKISEVSETPDESVGDVDFSNVDLGN